MSAKCKWREETIIDVILGETNSSQKEAFVEHLPRCQNCQLLYHRWQALLLNNKEENLRSSIDLRGKIYRSLLVMIGRRRYFGKPLLIFSFVGVLLISGFLLGRMTTSPFESPVSPIALSTDNVEDTKQKTRGPALPASYQVLSIHHQKMDGYVWLNRETKDILIFLSGLRPLKDKDYQAWIVSEDNDKQIGGLLQMSEGMGHVYVHKPGVAKVRKLIISVEPRGGSRFQTGPETVNLDLSTADQF
ncbi:hypothetical protein JOD43_000679 [Pullulanibacillus pueri]|uniref:Anti-sigma K factor RskA C-terminal domain-containing protein n=1 Tax=Pullulanibacillus pueri TaxID=1437324 RepID=A0A8J2ZYI8_9BACL|nr:anti-sigma factor [Pullulanibacillus pueri]MBM7680517.1 hypothetical protein [Pullulanibacillus pueri]GGH86091.1 hypothetical protein GCM10007096_32990 [Pullulanibacillus pueri]